MFRVFLFLLIARYSCMFWFVLIVWVLYFLALLSITVTWSRIKPCESKAQALSVSVIVPFRNEAQHLTALIEALERQVYQDFEVVFVNDHSTDTSEELLTELLSSVSFNYQRASLSDANGKKAAIEQGVGLASGGLVLTTDADCVFGDRWIQVMSGCFADDRVQMVSGPVKLTGQSLFQKWQQMEFSVLIGTGAAGITWQKPSMANGANLAYRKSVFQELGGFEGVDAIASGDDELLIMKVHQKYPTGIRFVKESDAIVSTEALASWSTFQNQRLRWAGKWRFGRRKAAVAGALTVFLFNLSFLLLPFLGLLDILRWWQVLGGFMLRFLIELNLVLVLNGFFRQKLSFAALLLHQILYPLYAVYFGLAANFGSYRWKGRTYKTSVQ